MEAEAKISNKIREEYNELLQAIAKSLIEIHDRLDQLSLPSPKAALNSTGNEVIATGFTSLEDILNCEATFFDNGSKQGKARFTMKIEANVVGGADRKFKEGRDLVLFADLFTFHEFPAKLNARKGPSFEYRQRIMENRSKHKIECDETLIGMFNAKTGKQGTLWFEDQYIFVRHNGDFKVLDATLFVNGAEYLITGFDTKKNPKTGKAFTLDAIKGKAICNPRRDLLGEDA